MPFGWTPTRFGNGGSLGANNGAASGAVGAGWSGTLCAHAPSVEGSRLPWAVFEVFEGTDSKHESEQTLDEETLGL